MFEFYNPHPDGKFVGDCVKRAFCKVTAEPYREVQKQLNAIKREIGGEAYNDNRVWQEFIKRHGWFKINFPSKRGERMMDGFTFCEEFAKGTYVLSMAGHLCACVDGVIYDTWDCRSKCVYTAFRVK